MGKHLYYFRPGEEARMLARCQFGIATDGRCGATLTYPIKGYPWRRNPMKSYEFQISEEVKSLLFSEISRIRQQHPSECLAQYQLWSDMREKGNGITRDRPTNKLCHTVGVFGERGDIEESYSLRENSEVLLGSALFETITELVRPYEML